MPRSRKRHHSRSRSKTRSRSPSCDRTYEKVKKPTSKEKDGKRRRLDEVIDSPQKRSISFDTVDSRPDSPLDQQLSTDENLTAQQTSSVQDPHSSQEDINQESTSKSLAGQSVDKNDIPSNHSDSDIIENVSIKVDTEILSTPKKPLTPKQLQKRLESEKKKLQKQKEREEKEKQKQEEKMKLLAEKQKIKEQKEAERLRVLEEKQRQIDLKQKEKELKEEQKKKEKEEKEQKRKEREEQEAMKRKEKEEEKLKEKEKNQKTVALFKNFFKKTEAEEQEIKTEKVNSRFMPFEIKSDMKLPPVRRNPLPSQELKDLDNAIKHQDKTVSYLKQLQSGQIRPRCSSKTWPCKDLEEDVVIIEDLGEKIFEDASTIHRMKAKFMFFHENKRPAYYGTWRKKSKFIKPRRPFEEDCDYFNYEEDSDDDWEDEEQGESLDVSGEEDEKDVTNGEDEYEVDNDFFVPHGHLSDDEIDDEDNASLTPETLKQKLKLLKDEFDEDMKSKTQKLKPRSIGCVWFNEENKIDEAIYRYLQPFEMIVEVPIEIDNQLDTFTTQEKRKSRTVVELPVEHIPYFLKMIHGNVKKKRTIIEEFLTSMGNKNLQVDVSKANLIRFLKQSATYRKPTETGAKNKCWLVNDDVIEKYKFDMDLCKVEN